MNDDFNTAQVLAQRLERSSKINALTNGQIAKEEISLDIFFRMKRTFKEFVFDILGLKKPETSDSALTGELIELLIDIRKTARENKDFETSDKIWGDLGSMGVLRKDGKGGTTFEIDSERHIDCT